MKPPHCGKVSPIVPTPSERRGGFPFESGVMANDLHLPLGFQAAGVYCGIKSDPEALDLCLFVSDRPAAAAGVFTTNRVCGAPVIVSRRRVPSETARAVLINSGNANACTGDQGVTDAKASTSAVAKALGCAEHDVLVCSTGVIGHHLPMPKLVGGIDPLIASLEPTPSALERAARGMMTTDTIPKMAHRAITYGKETVHLAGAAKGAAMIAPNMATMLAVVMTDARVSAPHADRLLRDAVDRSFNRISVDGHTSTSDTVLLLANGASGVEVTPDTDHWQPFQAALRAVCQELASAIIRDAEGASHFITVRVKGLKTEADALQIARTIANSALVKTAIAGADPNWGRIVSAAGYAGIPWNEERLRLTIQGTEVFRAGGPSPHDAAALSRRMREERDILLELTFEEGDASADMLTSDLTAEYVRLNAEYTT